MIGDVAEETAATAEEVSASVEELSATTEHVASVARELVEVAEQLRDVATRFNIGNLLLLLHFGNMDKTLANYNTRLFAEKVLPKLKDLHSEWPHHWWPQPMNSGRADLGLSRIAAE